MRNIFFAAVFLALWTMAGCGYKIGSMTVGGVKTIAIGTVLNQTGKAFIQESTVSSTLVEQFHRDGSLKITSPDQAEAEIQVTLVRFTQNAQAFTQQGITQNLRMHLDADVIVKSKSGQTLYQGHVQGQADYGTQLDQTEIERITVKSAIKDLCIDIVQNVVQGGGW